MGNKNFLFAYGTLRKDYNLELKNVLSTELEYIGKGKVDGSLYDIGSYPGAVEDDQDSEIVGDLFLVSNPDRVFEVLDKYEGYLTDNKEDSEFVRKKNKVRLSSGKSVFAWIYWYNLDTQGKLKIRDKDYLNYLKNKKTA